LQELLTSLNQLDIVHSTVKDDLYA